MEFCDMETLQKWINQRNEAGEDSKRQEESFPIKLQIIIAVEYIHRQKLIHRDLKVTRNSVNLFNMNHGTVRTGIFICAFCFRDLQLLACQHYDWTSRRGEGV